MANAAVDKIKSFGLLHGEKVVVGLSATAFVVLTALALMHPAFDMKAEQLNSTATDASTNIQRKQDEKDILAKLEKDGLSDPNFEKVVENQIANALKPGDYRARLDWVTPEPGAGLIRDTPVLIAPTDLYAFPGRGGILMYELENGERKILTPEEAKKKAPNKKSGGGRPSAPGMGGSAMMGGGDQPPAGGPPANETPEAKKRRELEEQQRKAAFAGNAASPKDKSKEGPVAPPATPEGPFVEVTRGKRWIVITGVIDNAQLKKNYLVALKNEAVAYPNYKRLDVQRQVRQDDGSWTDWADIDQNKNYEVLDNLPEYDKEFVPENQRASALVDPLPFLRAGYWTGVHVARLVPPDILETPKAPTGPAQNKGRGPSGPGMMGSAMGEGRGSEGMSAPGTRPGSGSGGSGMGGSGSRPGAPGMGMGMGDGPGGGGVSAGATEDMSFTKYDEPTLMLRSLDFTVDPNKTYRFQVRIVVVNPNKDREDVNPGVDTTAGELTGPWSEPTDEVTIPADVTAYAQLPQESDRRDDLVTFQVIRWDTNSGQTVVKNDIAGPGQIVGEPGKVPLPDSEGGGAKPTDIDFNSRAIVLDTFGGRKKLPEIGVERNKFEVPAMAMLVEPDGSVVLRSQALDRADEVRSDMEENYNQAVKDSTIKREPGTGTRMPGSGGMQRNNRKKGRR